MRKFRISNSAMTLRKTRSIKTYLSELGSISILTPDEENELAILVSKGDEKATQKLVTHNLKFVVSVAKQYERKGVELEDLINEGNIGLVKAAQNFDPTKGFKFITFAIWSIRQQMLTYVINNGKTIRLSANKIGTTYKLKQRVRVLEQKLERKPSYDEIVNAFGGEFTMGAINFFMNEDRTYTKSLDEKLGNDEDSQSFMEIIADSDSIEPTFFIDLEESNDRKELLLKDLSKRDRLILELSIGLTGNKPMLTEDIAKKMGLSIVRINQIKRVTLLKLKEKLLNQANWMIT